MSREVIASLGGACSAQLQTGQPFLMRNTLAETRQLWGDIMWSVENRFAVRLGGNTYINTPDLVVYKGEPLFRMYRSENEGILGIDFDVYDAAGQRVAVFRKGVVVHGDTENYDIKSGHEEYTVTEKATGRQVASVKRRSIEGAEMEVSVRLYTPDGFLFDASPTETNVGGMTMTGCVVENCGVGIVIK